MLDEFIVWNCSLVSGASALDLAAICVPATGQAHYVLTVIKTLERVLASLA